MIENPRIKPDSDNLQVLYVGKHGSDTSDGETWDRAFLTFGAAITAAGTPANEAAAVTIVCLDNGTYTEDIETPSWVNIFAPRAAINTVADNGHEIKDNCWWQIWSIHAARYAVWKHNTESGYSFLKCQKITRDDVTNMAVRCSGGTLEVDIGLVSGISGALECQADFTTDVKITGRVETIEVSSGTSFIIGANVTSSGHAYIDVSVGSVKIATGVASRFFGANLFASTGTVHANIRFNEVEGDAASGFVTVNITAAACEINAVGGELNVATAYNVAANCALNLVCGRVAGTRTEAVGSQVRVTEARKKNYVATVAPGVGDDVDDGYSVGSVWINVTGDDAYVCVDASSGAAVWKQTTP